MTKIQIRQPDKSTPGFLKRAKRAVEFQSRLQDDRVDPVIFDEMIEFVLPFVVEPADRKKAREALWDASQEQFEKVMSDLTGGGKRSEFPPESSTPSGSSTSQA